MKITIDDAITDLQARVDGEFSIKGVDDCRDMKLGIEALNRLKSVRSVITVPYTALLPSETR